MSQGQKHFHRYYCYCFHHCIYSSINDEIVASIATVRKPLGYFGSTFLLFVTYFFLYAPLRSTGGLKTVENNRGLKIAGNNEGLETARNNGSFQTTRSNNGVSKNCQKVIICHGFVKLSVIR